MTTILEAKKLNKTFHTTPVLQGINLSVEQGEFLVIMGPSGSGKSTLLYNISGMDTPTGGQVLFQQQDLTSLEDKEISALRLNNMGFVFQNSYLLKNLSIRDNVVLPSLKAGLVSREKINQRADDLLAMTGISEIGAHDIKQVSGGQLQRAAICRALINQPMIIFGDEPTGALNSSSSKEAMDILNSINQQGTTIVLVTHDPKVAARASRIIYLIDGKIHAERSLEPYSANLDLNASREKEIYQWLEQQGF